MSILVPFLVFAIAVSHGVQMVSSVRSEIFLGADSMAAARTSFRRLLVPGGIALATDTIGFFTILFIQIRVIQEIAIAASIGVAAIILINLVLLPVLLSYFRFDARLSGAAASAARATCSACGAASRRRPKRGPRRPSWRSRRCWPSSACGRGEQVQIGDLHRGVPELRADSRYNMDTAVDHVEVLDRRRHPERDRRDQARRLRRPRGDDDDRRVLVAHGEPAGRPVDDRPAARRQAAERRLERGQPEVAGAVAQPVGAHPVGDLRADLDRAAQLRLQRDAGDAVHRRPQGDHHRADRGRGQEVRSGPRQPRRLLQARHGQRRRDGRDQRGGGRGAVADHGLRLRLDDPAVPGLVPLGARHALHPDPARRSCRCCPTP